MKRKLIEIIFILGLLLFYGIPAYGLEGNSVTFDNQSGEYATVKLLALVGNGDERRGIVNVPDGTKSSLENLETGKYYFVVKYKDKEGRIRCGRGDNFEINPPAGYTAAATITLHPVVGGKYHIGNINEALFDAK